MMTRTNFIAHDVDPLVHFYEDVFGSARVPPVRAPSGDWLDRTTNVPRRRRGMLRNDASAGSTPAIGACSRIGRTSDVGVVSGSVAVYAAFSLATADDDACVFKIGNEDAYEVYLLRTCLP